ncbi:MAG: hypothetical protein MUE96_10985 [Bacteroidia bacterium]|nr:hypothetical protein [Bacteroidia bacterium]
MADRQLRNTYQTNRSIKYYGFYCALKSLTSSGLIKDYAEQIELLCEVAKKSRSSFYTYLNECIKLNLIQKNNDHLRLTCWDNLIERFNLKDKVFTEYTYDTEQKGQTPEYYLASAEIQENQQYQASNVLKQIRQNPHIKSILNEKETNVNTVEKLQWLQMKTFVNGCGGSEAIYSVLHSLNADIHRSVPKLRKAFNLKSNRSVGYLKGQLEERGFAVIKGRLLKSPERMRKSRVFYHTGWDKTTLESTWQLPDSITIIIS